MSKGMTGVISVAGVFLLSLSAILAADIWKVVDEDGNIVYTDQPPKDGTPPMVLPELSVIEVDIQGKQSLPDGSNSAGEEGAKELTTSELRKIYRDFRITRPLQEETYWGTGNSVVVTWASKTPLTPDLNVRLFVDGTPENAPATGGMSLTLDRGEHKVFAELRDARNRRILTTRPVTFFIKQSSVNFNRPRPSPSGGSG